MHTLILGKTLDDKTFRPSDWAQRLCGVMSSFREGSISGFCYLDYSPWCEPIEVEGTVAVRVDHQLKDHHIMAWDFVMNFAKDNQLQTKHQVQNQDGA